MRPSQIGKALGHLWSSSVNSDAVAQLGLEPGETVLDIGAGFGPSALEAAAAVGPAGSVVAVDPSRVMRLVLAVRRTLVGNARQITVLKGSGEDVPLPDRSVDAAISMNVMHHLDNLKLTAAELYRVMHPGGRVLLIDEDFGHEDHSFHADHGSGPHFIDPADMVSALEAAGFVDAGESHEDVGGEISFVIRARKGTE